MDLDALLRFIALTHQFQMVERKIYATGLSRNENDVEHSYQLALVAWYIVSTQKLTLDIDKIVRYSLVHDFVEVFAGDTFFYGDRTGKEEREAAAQMRLVREYPEFSELHAWIAEYEEKKDKESLFVHSLDKVLPVLNIYLDGGRTWKEHGITFAMLSENKRAVVEDERIKKLLDQVIERLRAEAPNLFASK